MTNLFLEYYQDKNQERQKELEHCVLKNIENKHIDRVFIFIKDNLFETNTDWISEKLKNACMLEKVVFIINDNRLTFDRFFKETENHPEDINILCNTDIYFDETIEKAKDIKENECYALLRHDIQADGSVKLFCYSQDVDFRSDVRSDSQDAWIVKGAVKNVYGDFMLGICGTDNRIAYEFAQGGYAITNPSLDIKCYHYHLSNIRNYIIENLERIPAPYKLLTPQNL